MTRTVITPWSPGEPVPPELIRLVPGPELVGLLEDRARDTWRKLQARRRLVARMPEPYRDALRVAVRAQVEREAAELRALLHDRRELRAWFEAREDRADWEAKQ